MTAADLTALADLAATLAWAGLGSAGLAVFILINWTGWGREWKEGTDS